ncbi:MAG: hypothetical protein MUC87_20310 [Bacteroidia bacterium]|jgi:hypothetical protein|nr:hypothetical protein [Bacteroidia bacterium]
MKIIAVVFALAFLVIACSDYGRMPGTERIEKNCLIKLPSQYQVIKDEYEGLQDYTVRCDLKFSPNSAREFAKAIQSFPNYNLAVFDSVKWCENCSPYQKSPQGVWYRTARGFRYFRVIDFDKNCRVDFDTVRNLFSYTEETF